MHIAIDVNDTSIANKILDFLKSYPSTVVQLKSRNRYKNL